MTGAVGKTAMAATIVAAALARSAPAAAHAHGIVVDSCDGCHGGGGGPPTLTLTPDRATFNPGDSVTFTLTIRSGSIQVGGTFIGTGGIGTFQALAGEGLAVSSQGLTHTAPKAAMGGAVTFRFAWQAPSKPGGVDFRVAALAGNGNNAPTGDSPGAADVQWVFGCAGRTFFLDLDRDGYGSNALGTRLGCAGDPAPTGFATMDGDCDENDEKVHPDAIEICNGTDDNCNGQIDENAPAVMMWPDGDGDGYYKSPPTGTSKVGCGDVPGYATRGGDCNDMDPTIHPGGTEICNNKDDNCDGEIDERVRPQCGVGWCARYSTTCNPADCHPGPPAVEVCNAFDDDCDGENDNGACATGMVCSGDQCVPSGAAPPGTGGSGSGGSIGSAGGSIGSAGGSIGSAGGSIGSAGGEPSRAGCAVAPFPPARAADARAGDGLAALALAACLSLSALRARRA
jgi:hypothetical protein